MGRGGGRAAGLPATCSASPPRRRTGPGRPLDLLRGCAHFQEVRNWPEAGLVPRERVRLPPESTRDHHLAAPTVKLQLGPGPGHLRSRSTCSLVSLGQVVLPEVHRSGLSPVSQDAPSLTPLGLRTCCAHRLAGPLPHLAGPPRLAGARWPRGKSSPPRSEQAQLLAPHRQAGGAGGIARG